MKPVGNRDSLINDLYIFGKPLNFPKVKANILFSDLDRALWDGLLFPVLSDLEENNEISY